MTNPTTPFSWQMPTASDLVTDLPADFETFGQAVATSMADLLGGTTGQVLAKNSNTDMDFVWVAQDDSNAIQNAIVDAKGDLIAASAADTPARLAVGANGETLVADSSTSTGLRYQATMAGGKNCLINGGFDIWQRGTTFNSIANYTADRWVVFPAAGTLNATQSTDVPTSPYFNYSLQVAGVSSTGDIIRQRIEAAQSTPLAGQTVTLSVYAKSSAGTAALKWNTQVPSATNDFNTVVQDQSGTFSATPAGTWTRYTATFAVSANAVRGYELRIYRDSATSSNTTLYAGIQLEIGSVATQFTRAGGTIQGELAACQRYYWRSSGQADAILGTGVVNSGTTGCRFVVNNPVSMRTSPTSVDYSTLEILDADTAFAISSLTLTSSENSQLVSAVNAVSSGLTLRRFIFLRADNSTSAYIGFSAEL